MVQIKVPDVFWMAGHKDVPNPKSSGGGGGGDLYTENDIRKIAVDMIALVRNNSIYYFKFSSLILGISQNKYFS